MMGTPLTWRRMTPSETAGQPPTMKKSSSLITGVPSIR
jgi:hypothetical protein